MELFVHVLTDYIHFAKLIVLCNMFFVLQKRKVQHSRLMVLLVGLMITATSVFIFYSDNDFIEILIYAIVIYGMAFLLYNEKVYHIIISVTGIIFASSMIDEMSIILVDILMQLFNMKDIGVDNLISSFISIALIYVVGRIYRKNTSSTLQTIGVTNLIGFTVLLAVDTFVVVAIISQPNFDLYLENKKVLYLISIVLVIIGIFVQLASVILLFTQRNVYKEKKALTDKYLDDQKNHYEYLENREKETKKFRHDLGNHMEMISNLAKTRQYDRIDAYLEQMHIKINDFGNLVTVHNGIVDAIINQYYAKAQECGVNMEVRGRFPVDCAIDAFDLCTIFSNVLSNALEAAKESDEKRISVECAYTDMSIMIIVTNSYKPEASNGSAPWRTRKSNSDYHGYGLENIKDSVKKYKGDLDIETEDNIFILRILFKNMEKQIDGNSNSR